MKKKRKAKAAASADQPSADDDAGAASGDAAASAKRKHSHRAQASSKRRRLSAAPARGLAPDASRVEARDSSTTEPGSGPSDYEASPPSAAYTACGWPRN